MELTSEDKQRIEQEAKLYAKNHSAAPDKETPDWIIMDFCSGAEYEHKYQIETARQMKYVRMKTLHDHNMMLANKVKQLEAERSELVKENERLKNDLLDALDLKEGKGPTALSMQAERIKELEELLKRCESHIDMEGGADELIKELKAAITK